MPRQDINGNDFVHFTNFPNDLIVRNIEFAAGKTFFGKREFPNCYLTDKFIPQVEHFTNYPNNYEEQDCHYLDQELDYYNAKIEDRTFDNIVFCNPYGIGFRGKYQTKSFLETAYGILSDNGTIIVLGNSTNQWSQYDNLNKYYGKLKDSGELAYDFIFSLEAIDDAHPYRNNHQFYVTNFSQVTIPNQLIRIKKA